MKTILKEEEYFERLSSLLKRDFFPSLETEFSEPEQLSISEFQCQFTTEDNASFEVLLARENERKRGKFERVYGNLPELADDPSRRLLLQESRVDEWKMRGKNGKVLAFEDGKSNDYNTLITPTINLKNTRFYEPPDTLNKFKVPPSPAREQLAHSLSSKAKVVKPKLTTPKVPNYSLQDLKGLTPKRSKK